MKIDRHNYEEFFILYWDNELTAEQKQLVEDFVSQNDDLKEEFRMLQQTRFIPETELYFENKETLLKKDSEINAANYEQFLLSYIDDELSPGDKISLQHFLQQHPSAQRELAVLQKTKLEPETILFPGKESLYRSGKKTGVVSMTWFRVAVAAVLIIAAGLITMRVVNTPDQDPAGTRDAISQSNDPGTPAGNTTNESKDMTNGTGLATKQVTTSSPSLEKSKNQLPSSPAITRKEKEGSSAEKEKPVYAHLESTEKNTGDVNLPVIRPYDRKLPTIEPDVADLSLYGNDVTERTSPSSINSDVQFASFKEEDNGGIRGFLRKATRVFERRTNVKTTTDDNKLLLGAFAVSLN